MINSFHTYFLIVVSVCLCLRFFFSGVRPDWGSRFSTCFDKKICARRAHQLFHFICVIRFGCAPHICLSNGTWEIFDLVCHSAFVPLNQLTSNRIIMRMCLCARHEIDLISLAVYVCNFMVSLSFDSEFCSICDGHHNPQNSVGLCFSMKLVSATHSPR